MWNKYFGSSPCALSVIPCANPGIGQEKARIEINVLAVKDAGATRKQIIGGDLFTGYDNVPAAVKAGDLLLLSGLMAVDGAGSSPQRRSTRASPTCSPRSRRRPRAILERAAHVCALGGTDLSRVVRIQHFHTDLRELLPALEVWQQVLPARPLPFTAVETPPHMPAPGVSLIADLWVHAP